nr:citrate lyase subunit alpha [Klebsiella pneumoniae]
MVVAKLAELSFRDLTLASSSLIAAHLPLIEFFNDTATTEIYTRSLVGSVRCV